MKSIVLCERTLVHESEDFSNLKDDKLNKEGKEKAEKKINGVFESKRSETVINSLREAGKSNDHESNESSQAFKVDVGNKCRFPNEIENGTSENSASDGTYSSRANARYNLCSDGCEKDCLVPETNFSIEDKIAESDARSSSGRVQEINLYNEGDVSIIDVKPCVEASEIDKNGVQSATNERKINNSVENSENSPLEKGFAFDTAEVKEESERSVVNIDVDIDENKENQKEVGRNEIDEFPGNNLLNKQSSECDIQVGDVQSITGSEKDSMWSDNDFKGADQNLMEVTGDKLGDTPHDVSSTAGDVNEKDENRELEMDETVVSEAEENVENMREKEDEQQQQEEEEAMEVINEEEENDVVDLEKLHPIETVVNNKKKIRTGQRKKKNSICRKRHISQEDIANSSAKKKRLSRGSEEDIPAQIEEDNTKDSSRCEGLDSPGQISSVAGPLTKKRISTDDKNGKKLKGSPECEKSKMKKEFKFAVLEKFRGTLKNLTRSDLEELIIQKLCEVITERSNVGELRRKAQALEQDQERWKTKVQALTKQMREMEMVMKKYITEVQKQVKNRNARTVTPVKLTRSVGLQVSFYSGANKASKPGLSPPAVPSSPTQNLNARNAKSTSPKIASHFTPPNQNQDRNKSVAYQKGSPTAQKAPISQQRRSIVPKPDYVSHRAMPQSLLSSSRGVQNQSSRATYKPISGTTTAMTTTATTTTVTMTSSATSQQQQQQNGSKVIDLTDDDDRQTGNVVKTPGPIRVVNHLSQPPASQNNRFAYLLPTTNASTATSGGQSRQVLIATPTMPQSSRQIMCSMPPLLFKGGNVIQSGPQTHVNHSNKVILPKNLRHPAPLPQQPVNQNNRPNLKLLPPRPALKISKVQTGIVLSWNMSLSSEHAPIASYQLYAYQESNSPPATSLWKKVGDVKALPLPMACTLTQFMSGHKYHFAVRAVDHHSRIGPFSFPGTIVLVK